MHAAWSCIKHPLALFVCTIVQQHSTSIIVCKCQPCTLKTRTAQTTNRGRCQEVNVNVTFLFTGFIGNQDRSILFHCDKYLLSAPTLTGSNVRSNLDVFSGISLTLHCGMLMLPGKLQRKQNLSTVRRGIP